MARVGDEVGRRWRCRQRFRFRQWALGFEEVEVRSLLC